MKQTKRFYSAREKKYLTVHLRSFTSRYLGEVNIYDDDVIEGYATQLEQLYDSLDPKNFQLFQSIFSNLTFSGSKKQLSKRAMEFDIELLRMSGSHRGKDTRELVGLVNEAFPHLLPGTGNKVIPLLDHLFFDAPTVYHVELGV